MFLNTSIRLQIVKDLKKYSNKATRWFVYITIFDLIAIYALYWIENRILNSIALTTDNMSILRVIFLITLIGFILIIIVYWLNQCNEVRIKRLFARSKSENMDINPNDIDILRACVDHKLPRL